MNDPQKKRRMLLLKAAEQLFIHYGPTKTTVADIARDAGVGVGTVYLEFSSKDHILAELVSRRHALVLTRMRQAASTGDTAAERLQAVLGARVQAFLDTARDGAHACDLVHCGCPAVEAAWREFQQQELALITQLIDAGAQAGEFAATNPAHTASVILKAYALYSPPLLFRCNSLPLQEDLTLLHSLILRGLVTR